MPYVETNGIKMHYTERGSGEPLVLIMGFGAPGEVWEAHAAYYEKYFRCILIDNRGVGLTDKPEGPYNTDMMSDDVAGLMDALDISQARIAGISMGGAIAQKLAIRYPEKVKAMVLIATWAKFDQYAITCYDNLKAIRPHIPQEAFMQQLQLWIFAAKYHEEQQEGLIAMCEGAKNNPEPQPNHAFDGQLGACQSHDAVSALGDIKCPTLIVVGEDDIFTPVKFSKVLHEGISGSKLDMYPLCSHAVHWEVLETFNKTTTDFLKSN